MPHASAHHQLILCSQWYISTDVSAKYLTYCRHRWLAWAFYDAHILIRQRGCVMDIDGPSWSENFSVHYLVKKLAENDKKTYMIWLEAISSFAHKIVVQVCQRVKHERGDKVPRTEFGVDSPSNQVDGQVVVKVRTSSRKCERRSGKNVLELISIEVPIWSGNWDTKNVSLEIPVWCCRPYMGIVRPVHPPPEWMSWGLTARMIKVCSPISNGKRIVRTEDSSTRER